MNQGKVDVLLGLQWGDEGKGKVVDVLTPSTMLLPVFRAVPMPVIHWSLRGRSMCCALSPLVSSRVVR